MQTMPRTPEEWDREPWRAMPRMDDDAGDWRERAKAAQLESQAAHIPLSPRFAERLRWMESESKFAHACPDLDQEYPAQWSFPMQWYLEQLGDA